MSIQPTLIPVAGGKGGVGKSVLTAALGAALAAQGKRTVVADLDLGGSNLHSFLGLPNRYAGVGDYLKVGGGELADFLVPTEVEGLLFLPGDGKNPFMANITWHQKRKLLQNLPRLPADYVLLDLGAGTSFHTLDFYNAAARGLLVTTPELPAVMGMLVFLKNAFLRRVEREIGRKYNVNEAIDGLYCQPMSESTLTVAGLRKELGRIAPLAAAELDVLRRAFRPRVVFNMARRPGELELAERITTTMKEVLSLEVDFFGFIFEEDAVREAVRQQRKLLPGQEVSEAGRAILRVAERVIRFWDQEIPDSARRLEPGIAEAYARMKSAADA